MNIMFSDVTCARTDIVHFRRSTKVRGNPGKSSHTNKSANVGLYNIPVKILNEKGPLGKPLLPIEQFQRSLLHEQTSLWDNRRAVNATFSLLHLPKRVSNIEQFLNVNQGINTD